MGERLQLVAGAVVALAILAVAVILVTGVGGTGDERLEGLADVPVPPRQISELGPAVRAAGCVVREFPAQGRTHTTDRVRYATNPPTSGDHFPEPARERAYDRGDVPSPERLVHALEHGRILVQYAPATPRARIDQLETLYAEETKGVKAYKTLLFANTTEMPYALAATAWTRALLCERFTDRSFDAIRAFREAYVDDGPEDVP